MYYVKDVRKNKDNNKAVEKCKKKKSKSKLEVINDEIKCALTNLFK